MENTISKTSEMSEPEHPQKDFSSVETWTASLVEHNKDSVHKRHFSDILQFKEHLYDSRSEKERATKLYMVSSLGPGIEYLRTFASHAQVETEAIESHLLRSRCRFRTVKRARGALDEERGTRIFALDYPKIVTRGVGNRDEKTHVDGNGTQRFSVRIDDRREIVLCRVTLWASGGEHDGNSLLLLSDELLDDERWRQPRNKVLSGHEAQVLQSFGIASDHTTSMREHVLQATTANIELNFNTLRDVLSEFCMEHWADFLAEFPTFSATVWTSDEIFNIKDMLRANLRMEKHCFISHCQTDATHLPLADQVRLEDWSYLLETLNQRLPDMNSLSSGSLITAETDIRTQRCINRITYLGAILLPFSIVAAILTLDGEFAPGKSMFWVYWVVGVPISGLVVLIIYADGIRRLTFGEWEGKEVVVEDDNGGNESVLDYGRPLRSGKERLIWNGERAPDTHMHREIGWAMAFASISGVHAAKRMMAKRQLDATTKLSRDV